MFEYGVIFLLILNAISLLHLQYYCFHFRKSIPSRGEVAENKSVTLLETVDEGVQILSDLADILESGSVSKGSDSGMPSSPIASLLTSLILNNSSMVENYGTPEQEGAVLEEDQNTQKEND